MKSIDWNRKSDTTCVIIILCVSTSRIDRRWLCLVRSLEFAVGTCDSVCVVLFPTITRRQWIYLSVHIYYFFEVVRDCLHTRWSRRNHKQDHQQHATSSPTIKKTEEEIEEKRKKETDGSSSENIITSRVEFYVCYDWILHTPIESKRSFLALNVCARYVYISLASI